MRNPKLIAIAILALGAIILILQNTESVETRLFFATVVMPRSLLLVLNILIGVGIGLFMGLRWSQASRKDS
jgi:uncharacterized integral membrane protein